MRSRVLKALAWVAVAQLMPSTAFANKDTQDFARCDGYQVPTKKSDGMTRTTWLYGLASRNGDIRRTDTFGVKPSYVAACDRALADPLLRPEFALRRAHLLQAKAVHQLAGTAHSDILETLRLSDLAGAELPGPAFTESIGLGNHAIRALVLWRLERKDEALAEIEALEALRPYALSITALGNIVRQNMDSSIDTHLTTLKAQAPLNPGGLFISFHLSMVRNRLAEAAEAAQGLSYDLPRTRGNWTVEGEDLLEYKLIAERAETSGAQIYCLTALGKQDEAAKTLADAREDLERAMTPPPPPTAGEKLSKRVLADFELRKTMGQKGLDALKRWTTLIQLRADAPQSTPDQLFSALTPFQNDGVPVILDLVMQLKSQGPLDDVARTEFVNEVLKQAEDNHRKSLSMDLAALRNALPRPETAAMQPRFKRAGDGIFLSDNGFSRRKMEDANTWTIRFTNDLASMATVEELALLSAAYHAKAQGFDGILILTRRTLIRTINMHGQWGDTSTIPSGHEAQLNVRLVNKGALPDQLKTSAWRILDADAIVTALSIKYPLTSEPAK